MALRFAHLDEAGTSRREPHAVVAGIVSHADKQWRALNQYLADIKEALVPAELRDGLIFHTKDMWHGSGKFDRERWPRADRIAIMEEIALIPSKFDIPVVCSIVDKKCHSWGTTVKNENEVDASNYALAFGTCASIVEYFMRKFAEPDEVATLIAEDVPHMRKHAQWGYAILQDDSRPWGETGIMAQCTPLTRIVEQPMFVAKDQSSILQISDLLAFVLCRRANGNEDVGFLLEKFAAQVLVLPEAFDRRLTDAERKKLGR